MKPGVAANTIAHFGCRPNLDTVDQYQDVIEIRAVDEAWGCLAEIAGAGDRDLFAVPIRVAVIFS